MFYIQSKIYEKNFKIKRKVNCPEFNKNIFKHFEIYHYKSCNFREKI